MFKCNFKSELAGFFPSNFFIWFSKLRFISVFISLLFVVTIFSGCQDPSMRPVVKTVYIQEDNLNSNNSQKSQITNAAKTGNDDINKEPFEVLDDGKNEISDAVENIIGNDNALNKKQNEINKELNSKSEETLEIAATPPVEPLKKEDLMKSYAFPDNSSKNAKTELIEKQQEQLETAALEAAFEMLAKSAQPIQIDPKKLGNNIYKSKKSKFRIGLLVPLTGPFSYLGDTISGGSELAFFKMQNPNIELLYFDTAGGDKVIEAANSAISSDVDVIIGPLFSDSVKAIKPLFNELDIPILSFSNNIDVAEEGVWVLGYLPEQQIDQLVDFAVSRGKQNFGILSSSSQLGNKITKAAENKLKEYGLSPRTVLTISNIEDIDQNELLNKIKMFAQYIDTEKDPLTLPPPVFDTVLLAGDTSFILQVAPILSYYDLGPDRALFIGIDRWNIPKMLNEPSLQNAILTLQTRPADEKFNKVWKSEFKIDSNDLARISFDATALVIATANINSDASLSERLVGQPGFIGFSGQFKMSRTGLTERIFEIMKISDNLLIKPSIQ